GQGYSSIKARDIAEDGPVSSVSRWRDSGHLERAIDTAGGQEAFRAAVAAKLDDALGLRQAVMGKRRGVKPEEQDCREWVLGGPGLPDRTRRRLHRRRSEPLRLCPRRDSQAHRGLRRRAAQDRLIGEEFLHYQFKGTRSAPCAWRRGQSRMAAANRNRV